MRLHNFSYRRRCTTNSLDPMFIIISEPLSSPLRTYSPSRFLTASACVAIMTIPHNEEVPVPLYEYECKKCGARVEKIQKFSDPPLSTCEKCGGELDRLLSAPAIQFKGSGWYVTDYARKSSGSEASGKSSGSPATSSDKTPATSTSSTTDSKPSGKQSNKS